MCCQNEPGYEHHGEHHGDCGCGGHGGESSGMHHGGGCCGGHGEGHHIGGRGMGFRRFISRDEIISRLEEYLKQLQDESKGVKERIAELKKTQT